MLASFPVHTRVVPENKDRKVSELTCAIAEVVNFDRGLDSQLKELFYPSSLPFGD